LAAANHNKKIMPKRRAKKHKKNGGLLITRRLAVRLAHFCNVALLYSFRLFASLIRKPHLAQNI